MSDAVTSEHDRVLIPHGQHGPKYLLRPGVERAAVVAQMARGRTDWRCKIRHRWHVIAEPWRPDTGDTIERCLVLMSNMHAYNMQQCSRCGMVRERQRGF